MKKSANFRFHAFILIIVIGLQILAARYVSLNDLAVYGAALEGGGVYEGDFSFELLQHGLSAVLGAERVIFGLQSILILLAVSCIYKIRDEVNGNFYIGTFLFFTSPVILIGLTNSIRQSLAFITIILAINIRNTLLRNFSFGLAVLMHNSSLLLIPLIFLIKFTKYIVNNSTVRTSYFKIVAVLFAILLVATLFFNQIVDMIYAVYDRYSVYIHSAVVFTEGRFGSEKIAVWTIFWLAVMLIPAFLKSSEWRMSTFPIIPILFTVLVAFDATVRGFDEFHSRLLMFNNVFVLLWLIELVKSKKNTHIAYFIVLAFNFLNPATIGVLI